MSIPTETRKVASFRRTNGELFRLEVPDGVDVVAQQKPGSVVGWDLYIGTPEELSDECAPPPVDEIDLPTIAAFTPTPYIPGQPNYVWPIPDGLASPSSGQTLTQFQLISPHSFLRHNWNAQGKQEIIGSIPVNQSGPLSIKLRINQNPSGLSVERSGTIAERPFSDIIVRVDYNAPFKRARVIVGPLAPGQRPTITLFRPGGATQTTAMLEGTTTVDGLDYGYFQDYENILTGTHRVKVDFLKQTKWGEFTAASTSYGDELELTNTEPGTSDNYTLTRTASIAEGTGFTFAVKLNGNPVTGGIHNLVGRRAGLTIDPATGVAFAELNGETGDGYEVTYEYTLDNVILFRVPVQIVDSTNGVIDLLSQARYRRQSGKLLIIAASQQNGVVQYAIRKNADSSIPTSGEYFDMQTLSTPVDGCNQYQEITVQPADSQIRVFLRVKSNPASNKTLLVSPLNVVDSLYQNAPLVDPDQVQLPVIIQIFRTSNWLNPGTIRYAVATSYIGNDRSRIPVARWKNETETNWRGTFDIGELTPFNANEETTRYDELGGKTLYEAGYRWFTFANVNVGSNTVAMTEIKPYGGSDHTIQLTTDGTEDNGIAYTNNDWKLVP